MKSFIAMAGTAFIAGMVLFPLVIFTLRRLTLGQQVRSDGPETHQKKQGTPTMGGVGIILVFLLTLLALGEVYSPRALTVVLVSILCFLLGLADDMSKVVFKNTVGLKARYRFLLQILLGLGLCAVLCGHAPWLPKLADAKLQDPSYILLPLGNQGVRLGWLIWPFVVFVFVGSVNSVNFTDGLDGLLAGCFIVTGVAFCAFLWKFGERSFIPVCLAMTGATAAFLWFNCHPAKVFMGDCGSLMLGGFIASLAILTRLELFLLVIGFIYVAEALSVIIQVVSFKTTGKRVFRMAPVHHHFELAGWPEPKVVVRFWMAAAIFGAVGLLLF